MTAISTILIFLFAPAYLLVLWSKCISFVSWYRLASLSPIATASKKHLKYFSEPMTFIYDRTFLKPRKIVFLGFWILFFFTIFSLWFSLHRYPGTEQSFIFLISFNRWCAHGYWILLFMPNVCHQPTRKRAAFLGSAGWLCWAISSFSLHIPPK